MESSLIKDIYHSQKNGFFTYIFFFFFVPGKILILALLLVYIMFSDRKIVNIFFGVKDIVREK